MDRHVSSVVSSCNFYIHARRHIRPRLTFDAAKSVAVSIVGARLDFCNSLPYGTSQRNFDRLQRVQRLPDTCTPKGGHRRSKRRTKPYKGGHKKYAHFRKIHRLAFVQAKCKACKLQVL